VREGACIGAATMLQPRTLRLILWARSFPGQHLPFASGASASELRTEEVASRRPVMEVNPVSISRVLQLEIVVCGGRLVSVGFRDAILGFGNPSVGFWD
jgi:hypothetical protein